MIDRSNIAAYVESTSTDEAVMALSEMRNTPTPGLPTPRSTWEI